MEEDFVIAKSIIDRVFPIDMGIIDVGSHEGDFVNFVLGTGSRKQAIMIEPIPEKAEIIRNRFPNAKVFQCAVSSEERKAEMFVTIDFPKCSALYDRQAFNEVKILNQREKIEISLRKLENILDEAKFDEIPSSAWYLKIDTEGFELETFSSIGKYASHSKILAGQFEYGGCWRERNIKLYDMIKMLEDAGFIAYRAAIRENSLYFLKIENKEDDYEHTNIYFMRKNLIEGQRN